jgi:hypothetical protein
MEKTKSIGYFIGDKFEVDTRVIRIDNFWFDSQTKDVTDVEISDGDIGVVVGLEEFERMVGNR